MGLNVSPEFSIELNSLPLFWQLPQTSHAYHTMVFTLPFAPRIIHRLSSILQQSIKAPS